MNFIKKKLIFFLVISSLFITSTIFLNQKISLNSTENCKIGANGAFDNTKSSKSWTVSPIFIDNSPSYEPGSMTWATFNSTYEWCNGKGTKDEPYIIENVTIDAGGSGSGIYIRESYNDYFIIRNCTIFNSGDDIMDVGIGLLVVDDGQLIDNRIINNGGDGLSVVKCSNVNLTGNIIKNNGDDGLYVNSDGVLIRENNITSNGGFGMILVSSEENIIIKNNLTNNHGVGIYLWHSNETIISQNNITHNEYSGIEMHISENNTISNNNISYNGVGGIVIDESYNNSILSSYISYNNYTGIDVRDSNNCTIKGNTINNNKDYGIELEESNNNIISANYLNYNERGLELEECFDNILKGNLMKECSIVLDGSLEETSSHIIDTTNKINGKSVYYYTNQKVLGPDNFTKAGNPGQVLLVNCNDSSISNLNISGTTIAIQAHYCINNTYSKNNISFNIEYGLVLFHSNKSKIIGNVAYNNTYGIAAIFNCWNNNITLNRAANNSYLGIGLVFSSYNTILKNNATNNYIGIILSYSDYNNITRNSINDSSNCGINLYSSNHNNISHNRLYRNFYCIRDEYSTGNFYMDNGDCKVTYVRETPLPSDGDDDDDDDKEPDIIFGIDVLLLLLVMLFAIIGLVWRHNKYKFK